jgi:hypothetical protein
VISCAAAGAARLVARVGPHESGRCRALRPFAPVSAALAADESIGPADERLAADDAAFLHVDYRSGGIKFSTFAGNSLPRRIIDWERTGWVRRARSTIRRGRIIRQTPRPGVRRSHGARVNLIVSRGQRE